MVFDGEMRHWPRILLAFTRPYFGTARIMSKAFAERTYSGGSSNRVSIFIFPAFRSRLSCARAVRIWLARPSARILCSLVLSGTAEVSTEGAIGRRRLYVRRACVQGGIRGFSLNSIRPQVEVYGVSRRWRPAR